jgi:hypothetical protein
MVRRGCPQGGVLSPLLWNMVINSLLVCLNNESLWAQGFADDIAIVINGKFLSTVCELMQKALFIIVALINIFTGWNWQQALFVHLANWREETALHFVCVSIPLLLH